MTKRYPGMDHSLYPYSPLSKRKIWRWPNGRRVAVCVYLYFEYWEIDPPVRRASGPQLQRLSGLIASELFRIHSI